MPHYVRRDVKRCKATTTTKTQSDSVCKKINELAGA